ncbi:MAG: hypothetical protein ACKVJG_25010 [Candidatus Latescibacterota bacterium]
MYILKNDELAVEILDPVADQERFGTRYCTGGYIFQVTDAAKGPLLSGPTYPDSFNVFDGQGIPDAFNQSPLRERNSTAAQALIVGVGFCDLEKNEVEEFCRWDIKEQGAAIEMHTGQELGATALELTRSLALNNRTLRSAVSLKNTGKRPIPIRWFPHPFYPQTASDELCRFNVPVHFPENDGFEMAASGFVARKNWPNWEKGYYQALTHDAHSNLVIMQKHPVVGLVAASCSYIPNFFPIWGNANTFSWEPFLERTLVPGQETDWFIDYEF